MFEGDDLAEAMGVPLFYGIVEALLLGGYCVIAWKLDWTKAPASDPLLKVLTTSYEVLSAEEDSAKGDGKLIVTVGQNTNSEDGDTIYKYEHYIDEREEVEGVTNATTNPKRMGDSSVLSFSLVGKDFFERNILSPFRSGGINNMKMKRNALVDDIESDSRVMT